MSLRVCLVSPFDWSQPHDVNEHVAGLAAGLRDLGHTVTVLAPSSRATDLIAGRRSILNGEAPEIAAIAAAVPISRRSRMGVAMGARAKPSLALAAGRYAVLHGCSRGLPSLRYLARRYAQAMTAATSAAPPRLPCPHGVA